MDNIKDFLFGRLTIESFQHDLLEAGAGIGMGFGLLVAVAVLFYFKRWKWLWKEWLTTLDPKRIGVMYFIVAALMLLRGGADALMMRAQQALASGDSQGILTSDIFQQVFSAHGTIMIFFVGMGLVFALFNMIIPAQIGARDVAFPFMNSVSFWLFAVGFILMNLSLVIGEFSAAGWLAYPPLSGLEYSPGVGVDYWIWSLQIAGIGSLLSGINFLVTIIKMRAPGMTFMKMPIFVWTAIGSLFLIAFAFPILTATLGMLGLDRLMGMHFFTSSFGGNPMMYVNLIWAWGHPEVYILILPAFGIFSEIVATFSSKRLFGYKSMVIAIVAITILSFTVWLHHFFTMGAGANVNAFFGIMTAVIAIPTGVKVFNWLFTMYKGRVRLTTPMLWFLGFIVTFTIGGIAGVLMSVPAIALQMHNTLFLVAHFHTMIIGGVLFGGFAGLTYWWPKFTGFMLNERLGRAAFWCWLIGFLTAFTPLYVLGLMGAVRRMDRYDASMGWQELFIVAGAGVLIIGLGVFFQALQLAYSIWKRKENPAGPDPWGARTLEWTMSTPPKEYNFAVIPKVTERDAFWAQKQIQKPREIPTYHDIAVPKNSPFGLFIAVGAFMVGFGLIWHMWWLALTGLVAVIVLLIIKLNQEDTERIIPSKEVARLDGASA